MSNVFGFPFTPYEGQKQLATAIFDACKYGKTAVLESPTGSGKSMAVICAVMSYLDEIKAKERAFENDMKRLKKEYEEVSTSSLPVSEVFKKQYLLNKQMDELIETFDVLRKAQRFYREAKKADIDIVEDSKYKYPRETHEDTEELKDIGESIKKIIYVSRTHSQLSQFAQEFQKTKFECRPCHLGSRAAFCLNEEVKSIPAPMVNCECQRLTKNSDDVEDIEDVEPASKKSKKEGCTFYNKSRITRMRDQLWNGRLITASMTDIGTSTQACPYFSAKASIPLSDVVLMPYSILFDPDTRESYGIKLKDNVIVVDEAHNFLETIYATSSFYFGYDEMKLLLDSLTFYKTVTLSTNQEKLWGVDQSIVVLDGIVKFVESSGERLLEQQLSPGFVRKELKLSSDYLKIARCIKFDGLLMESRGIVQRYWKSKYLKKESKVLSLLNKKKDQQKDSAPEEPPKLESDGLALISKFVKLLKVLGTTDDDVIVFERVDKTQKATVDSLRLRYFKLSIGADLEKVIKESNAFIMVGGTMRPVGYLSNTLKLCCGIEDVIEKQFPHVVDERNVLPIIVDKSPFNRPLSLKVGQLTDQVIDDYIDTIVTLMDAVPHGCIVFLPNYKLIETFNKKLTGKTRKKMFAESKKQNPNNLLMEFEKQCKFYSGALLLASAGGKLSEGINFADDMCRCVAVCGLPYPNMMDIEVKLRSKHAVKEKLCSTENEYLLNQTLRVVSQCVGRAIRHKNDYSVMLFMDIRYNGQPKDILPDWIKRNIRRSETNEIKNNMKKFYLDNKERSVLKNL
ncbi:unnamed protein product [Bursaphelenchus okinawaensis]|uniref:Helicase ATP-binding domain-containing protein n=1 Tax=Bursaphelenchus okinawaensis TaxID=465554 RepID=A0A811KKX9_9BILA|nr:unnamed protein product [Bursaphelenchus okinawaensis]CAG9105345.1 unnamed protein product [Bursaphelenchus okinawaensis]